MAADMKDHWTLIDSLFECIPPRHLPLISDGLLSLLESLFDGFPLTHEVEIWYARQSQAVRFHLVFEHDGRCM